MSSYPTQASAPPGSYNSGYSQPPPPYGQPATFQYTGNYQTTTVLVGGGYPSLGSNPATIQCPHCRATVTTSVNYEIGMGTWLIAGVILLLGFWCGCCLIPLCIDGCKDAVHSCPNCNAYIAKKSML
ncbi:lipopolysaccharide-induced tumor necrosis factor-alpha factor homolog [Symsagittifera roscoffensis]|uniref:lipopolysaccharide-induced tumor necrosis factor-alpha factor homolog n=1 Tax=Symsagittifera roscoffensis TaxID=84072 RepID=UPI00307C912D